jgi:hypothetical protein
MAESREGVGDSGHRSSAGWFEIAKKGIAIAVGEG